PGAFCVLGDGVEQLDLEVLQDVERFGRRGGRLAELAFGRPLVLGVFGERAEAEGNQQQRREYGAGDGGTLRLRGRDWRAGRGYVPRRSVVGNALRGVPVKDGTPRRAFPTERRGNRLRVLRSLLVYASALRAAVDAEEPSLRELVAADRLQQLLLR